MKYKIKNKYNGKTLIIREEERAAFMQNTGMVEEDFTAALEKKHGQFEIAIMT